MEARDCPSAPQITAFSSTVLSGHTVLLAGTVTDDNPASVNLSFTGQATGTVTANAYGNFQLQTQASALGAVFVVGVDGAGESSDTAQANISVPAPSFSNLAVNQSGPNRAVMVTGVVSSGSGVTITLSGVVSGTVTSGANGMFTFSGTASGVGQVNASATDSWGQTGTGAAQLTDTAPTITNFEGQSTGYDNLWSFQGRVNGNFVPGETITFAGIPVLQDAQVTVGNDGWFHFQVQLGPDDTGLVTATVTDWYGATGQAQYYI